MKHKKVIIIGAGIGGLALAPLLAKKGYQVTVIEKNESSGGRAFQKKINGFTFDMGPSWYMMPEVFGRYFKEFNKKPSDFFELRKLNPQYRVFFADGSRYDITGDIENDKRTFEELEKGSSKKFDQYLRESKIKYNIGFKKVLYKNASNILEFFDFEIIKNGMKLGAFQSMENYIDKFFKSSKLKQILEYNLVFLGNGPDNSPSIFSMMAHVDFKLGVWYPMGGFYELVKALVKIGEKYRVKYIYNNPVTKINVSKNKVIGVETSNSKLKSDIVVSNADYKFTEDLLSNQNLRNYKKEYWNRKVLSPSAFLIYLGVRGKIPKLLHHTLYFGDNWKKHFRDIFKSKRWTIEPSIYINKPTENDPSLAPKNHEAIMILVPIASKLKENNIWKENYANYIIEFLEKKLGIKLKERIVVKEIFSISDFRKRYNSFGGNALGGISHTLFQSVIWRPCNKSKKVKGLYFVGAGTIPGIGVPPAVISAHLVCDQIYHDSKKT